MAGVRTLTTNVRVANLPGAVVTRSSISRRSSALTAVEDGPAASPRVNVTRQFPSGTATEKKNGRSAVQKSLRRASGPPRSTPVTFTPGSNPKPRSLL
jgi:hypothetical protein